MLAADIVIGANFGDEGKGLVTDYLCSVVPKDWNKLGVLTNGGAQRGHTVVTPEGYRHVFHHFSSSSFVGADTFCSEYFIVNPVLFIEEYAELNKKFNLAPKVFIHKNCIMTTIYDMMINQIFETSRGAAKHGSCGLGIFETLYRNQTPRVQFKDKFCFNPLAMTVGEFAEMNYIDRYNFLVYVRDDYMRARFNSFNGNLKIDKEFEKLFKSSGLITHFLNDFETMLKIAKIVDNSIFDNYNYACFENGQGLLLDKDNMDYYPHLTPSNTGIKIPRQICQEVGMENYNVWYVTRPYMTRHGVGRFDTECPKAKINPHMIDLTNVPNPWQDTLRYGKLDFDDLIKRVRADYNLGYIFVTHTDDYPLDFKNLFPPYCSHGLTRNDVIVRYNKEK